MGALADEYTEYVLEQLAPIGRVTSARLFGGIGLSRGSVQFAMVMDRTLYFVCDDETRARYEAAGMQSFAYDTKKRRVQVRRYYELPEDVLLDPDELRVWAEEALRVAARARKAVRKPKRKKRKSARPRARKSSRPRTRVVR